MRERANSLMIGGGLSSELHGFLVELGELAKQFPDLNVNLLGTVKRISTLLNWNIDA